MRNAIVNAALLGLGVLAGGLLAGPAAARIGLEPHGLFAPADRASGLEGTAADAVKAVRSGGQAPSPAAGEPK